MDKQNLLDRMETGAIQNNLGKTFKKDDILQIVREDVKSVETNKDPLEIPEDETAEDNKQKVQNLEDEVLKLKQLIQTMKGQKPAIQTQKSKRMPSATTSNQVLASYANSSYPMGAIGDNKFTRPSTATGFQHAGRKFR